MFGGEASCGSVRTGVSDNRVVAGVADAPVVASAAVDFIQFTLSTSMQPKVQYRVTSHLGQASGIICLDDLDISTGGRGRVDEKPLHGTFQVSVNTPADLISSFASASPLASIAW